MVDQADLPHGFARSETAAWGAQVENDTQDTQHSQSEEGQPEKTIYQPREVSHAIQTKEELAKGKEKQVDEKESNQNPPRPGVLLQDPKTCAKAQQ